jgi:hypothetical protein
MPDNPLLNPERVGAGDAYVAWGPALGLAATLTGSTVYQGTINFLLTLTNNNNTPVSITNLYTVILPLHSAVVGAFKVQLPFTLQPGVPRTFGWSMANAGAEMVGDPETTIVARCSVTGVEVGTGIPVDVTVTSNYVRTEPPLGGARDEMRFNYNRHSGLFALFG